MFNKILYHIKCNLLRYLCLLFSTTIIALTGIFYIPDIIKDYNDSTIYNKTEMNEVWFGGTPITSECFYNLNGSSARYNNISISADLFMQMSNVSYEDNLFGVTTLLKDDECYISENIMIENGLEVGDILTISRKHIDYTIKGIISSQRGIDNKYNHDGVLVLGKNEKLLSFVKNGFIFFAKDGNTFLNADRVISLSTLQEKTQNRYIKNMFILLLIYIVTIVFEDLFIFGSKGNDYKLLLKDGLLKKKIYLSIFGESVIRFFIPIILVLLFNLGYIFTFKDAYLFNVGLFLLVGLLITLIYSVCYYLRSVRYDRIRK